jgi:hypothetical protein
MTEAQKAQLDAAVAKVEELQATLRDSLPLRATGGGHVFNELLTVGNSLKKLSAEVTVEAPVTTP